MKRLLMLAAFSMLTSPTWGFAETSPAAKQVKIENLAFEPKELTIQKGESVEWQNQDLVPHTATEAAGVFDSDLISAGASWARRFEAAGDFTYRCKLHPNMIGVIHVK